jgi:hypothetical protein
VTVQLIRVSDSAVIGTATTGPNGTYLITNVPPGTYYVDATAGIPAGATPSSGAPDPTAQFTVGPGDQYLDADIGFIRPNDDGTIGGTVWHDLDNDGVLDGGEPGLPGVSVDLIRDTNQNGVWDAGEPILATVTTDQNGDYSFPGVPSGSYLVRVTDTQNTLADYSVGPLGNQALDQTSKQQPFPITLAPNETNTKADFGYVKDEPLLGLIGNQVWVETDADGLFEPYTNGENDIEGVTVDLYRNGTFYGRTTTGASGDYVFTSLPAGTYTITVSDQFGILAGYVPTTLGTPGVDFNNQAQPYQIVLAAGGENLTADFGYLRPAAIGDYVLC